MGSVIQSLFETPCNSRKICIHSNYDLSGSSVWQLCGAIQCILMNAAINLARDPDEQVMLLSSDGSVAAERGGLGNSNNPQGTSNILYHLSRDHIIHVHLRLATLQACGPEV